MPANAEVLGVPWAGARDVILARGDTAWQNRGVNSGQRDCRAWALSPQHRLQPVQVENRRILEFSRFPRWGSPKKG